jgi:hypothetical protein
MEEGGAQVVGDKSSDANLRRSGGSGWRRKEQTAHGKKKLAAFALAAGRGRRGRGNNTTGERGKAKLGVGGERGGRGNARSD